MRKLRAPRLTPRRITSMLAVGFLTAVFAVVGPLTQPSYAAEATWDGDELFHEGNQYEREQPNPLPASDPRGRAGEVAYTWIETLSNGDQKAHTIFFENDSSIQAKETAILISYDYRSPNTYSSPSPPETLVVKAALLGDRVDNDEDAIGSTCSGNFFSGLGWILCPTANLLADFVDGFYEIVKQFLEVPLLSTGDESGIYDLWKIMRIISNVAFVIAFIIIIYSQITSIGISNYSIKAMLPRLIIAAILVNVSFWICALAIDAFNVLGHSLQNILMNIRENISIDNIDQLSWGGVTNWILAGGGTALALGSFALTPTVSGSLPALGFLLLSALISAAFAMFVAFVILAARQAIITVLVVIAPLAFVAYVLPNTEEYFHKWRKSLTTLLLFFPVFSLLFGGSQLAGLAILQRGIQSNQLHVMLLGMAVQVVPLVITPLLIKFSSGLLGTIANMTNSSAHGPLDRMKGWARNNAEYQAAKKRASIAQKLDDPNVSKGEKTWNRLKPGYLGLMSEQRQKQMEAYKAENEGYLSDRAEENRLRGLDGAKSDARGAAERSRARHRQRMASAVDLRETGGKFKSGIEGRGKEMAAARLDAMDDRFDLALHESEREAILVNQSAENMSGKFNAIIQEWKAGETGYTNSDYDSLSDKLKARLRGREATEAAERISQLTFDISQQEKRKSSADTEIKSLEVERLKADEMTRDKKLLKYAGGIDELGQHKVIGRARSEAGALHMENVKAYDSVYSNEAYSVQDLMNVTKVNPETGKMEGVMKDGSKPSELQIHAAIQRVFTKIGNNWSGQKVADMVAEQGMTVDKNGIYYDNQGVALGDVNSDEVIRRRDLQQILRDSIQQSKLQIKYISNTEQSKMESGLFVSKPGKTRSEELILFDSRTGKYDPQRIAAADPDELSRMVQVFRDPKNRNAISESERRNIVDAIERAQSNPNLSGQIKDRERGIMNVLAAHLDDREAERSARSKENYYYVATEDKTDPMYNVRVPATTPGAIRKPIEVRVPNEYDPTRQIDYVSGAGLHPTDWMPDRQDEWVDDWTPPAAPRP